MNTARQGWEERHLGRDSEPLRPSSSFLQRHLDDLPRGRALDVACGAGRHALLLARRGFVVDAVDFAAAALRHLQESALAEQLPVHPIQADLEAFPIPRDRYVVILNIRYLQRSLWPHLKQGLRKGGLLVVETFLSGKQQIGHPRNPAFLLDHGELARNFSDLEILDYDEGLFETESEPAYLARMLARRPSR